MTTIGKEIGVPLERFSGNGQLLLGLALTLLGAAAAIAQYA